MLHLAVLWKVLLKICLNVKTLRLIAQEELKPAFVCVVELVGIPSKACDTSSLEQSM